MKSINELYPKLTSLYPVEDLLWLRKRLNMDYGDSDYFQGLHNCIFGDVSSEVDKYFKKDWETVKALVVEYDRGIKKVIFNDPATIILWNDGSKTVVKCQPGDEYDPEKGFVMAYLKKLLGNDNTFNKEINKWVK